MTVSLGFRQVSVSFPLAQRDRMRLFPSLRKARDELSIKHALKGVSFELGEGDKVGLIGRNGSGKTTLLKVAASFLKPTSGAVEISGSVGALFGVRFGVNNGLSPRENIILYGRIRGMSKAEVGELIEDVAGFIDIGSFFDQPLAQFSAGMLARFNFALTTSELNPILLIDEGLGAGDKFFQDRASKRLQAIHDSARILIFASHSPNLLKHYCQKAILLEDGKIEAEGEIDDVTKFYEDKKN